MLSRTDRDRCSPGLGGNYAALKFLSPDANPPVPWHRVLSSAGTISSRGPGTDGAARQRDALVAEGVEVGATRSGELKVDLRLYGWFPAPGTIDIGVEVEDEEEEGEGEGEGEDAGADGGEQNGV